MDSGDELEDLRGFMAQQPAGRLSADTKRRAEQLLAEAWPHLRGGEKEGMNGHKVVGRTEQLTWHPPRLQFQIERHGATVLGSIFADLQEWVVDLVEGRAAGETVGRRMLGQRQEPLQVESLAAELAALMQAGETDERLPRTKTGKYRVRTSTFLPPASQQTTAGRQKRLNRALREILEPRGWKSGGSGWWSPPTEEADAGRREPSGRVGCVPRAARD